MPYIRTQGDNHLERTAGLLKGRERMFSGNKLVLVLPVILMLFLFGSGMYYIGQSEVVTNETLNQEISWDSVFNPSEDGSVLHGTWTWEASPEDGVEGVDYLGITFLDENDKTVSPEMIDSYSLHLETRSEKISIDGEVVDNGVVFPFTTEMKENDVIGSKGEFKVVTQGDTQPERAIISYLHTWEEHDGLKTYDARFFEREFKGKEHKDESFFWVAERFVDLKKGSLYSS
ncbi:hypothetical protein [Alteribacillus iranensis]|uniref:Uncharacterized protein n=1 Tax=Alteribacillus iranensis TaxID=930128 RepID=A0A1I1ZI94_9BACI|nr:hypothetical protein [Alteribacillus iranensis]SFE30050.1 hypothetical protein SAMN05192532_101195 [Alteribacillus iranensis]